MVMSHRETITCKMRQQDCGLCSQLGTCALVLGLSCVLLRGHARLTDVYDNPDDVPYSHRDSQDRLYVQTLTGKRWYVLKSQEHQRVYYADLDTQETMWEDPRTLPLTEEERASLSPEMLAALINDTAMLGGSLPPDAMTRALRHGIGSGTATMVAVVPLVLLTGAMAGRIWYLHTYHPEMLFPTKERKSRIRSGGRLKAQKTRGKLNQDGKGGRSNNT